MELEKKSTNVEFDVIYDDGTRKRVEEGILFEAKDDNHTMFHIGTSRKSVYNAFFGATIEMIEDMSAKINHIEKCNKAFEIKESKKIHTCKGLQMLNGLHVRFEVINNHRGWYFEDENVKVEGQNGACYGTAIMYCPFCGENLWNSEI